MKTVKAKLSLALVAKQVLSNPYVGFLLTVGSLGYVAISFCYWISPLLVKNP